MEHERIGALFIQLKHAQHVAGVAETSRPISVPQTVDGWDDIANEPVPSGPETPPVPVPVPAPVSSSIGPMPIEEQLIPLPSNGNVSQAYGQLELTHRITHADHHLN